MNAFKGLTEPQLYTLKNVELKERYKRDHKVPRETSEFKRPKFQVAKLKQKKTQGLRFKITKEIIEIEEVPGCICKFCLVQFMEPLTFPEDYEDKYKHSDYVRFTYTFLLADGRYKPGGQTTFIAPLSLLRDLLRQLEAELQKNKGRDGPSAPATKKRLG